MIAPQNAPPRILSLIPPLTQLNTPYPATAYLSGFLLSRGFPATQADLVLSTVDRENPDILLLSAPISGSRCAAFHIAHVVKEKHPLIVIVLGGAWINTENCANTPGRAPLTTSRWTTARRCLMPIIRATRPLRARSSPSGAQPGESHGQHRPFAIDGNAPLGHTDYWVRS